MNDLVVIDIEEQALWLSKRDPAAVGKAETCSSTANGGPVELWPVMTQKIIYNHRRDYQRVVLQAFGKAPQKGQAGTPLLEITLTGLGHGPTVVPSTSIRPNGSPLATLCPGYSPGEHCIDAAAGGLFWRLLGYEGSRIEEESPVRFIPFSFLIRGAGLVDQGSSGLPTNFLQN